MLHRYALEKLFALLLLTVAICLLADTAQSATIVVNPGDSIQGAIDAANPDDTILVNSGIYKENVNVTKKLVLRGVDIGTGKPIVDAERNGSAITLSADEITLEGFAVINASRNSNAGIKVLTNNNTLTSNNASNNRVFGIYLLRSCNNTITGNNASNNIGDGIRLDNSTNNNISGNSVRNNRWDGIYILLSNNNAISSNNASNNLDGIELWGSDYNTISGNNAANNNYYGIVLSYSSNNKMRNNLMSGNRYNFYAVGPNDIDTSNLVDGKPIYYLLNESSTAIDSSSNAGCVFCINCENITVKDLTISNSDYGIYFDNTSNSKILNSQFSSNFHGISLKNSRNNRILDNIASNNEIGYYLRDSSNNIISGNIASDSWGGIGLRFSSNNTLVNNKASNNREWGISLKTSSDNDVYLNNFINNALSAQSDSTNLWNSPQPLIYIYNGQPFENYMGNYWSDYNGTDANIDGIGDDPYRFTSEEDRYPLMMESESYIVSSNLNIDGIATGTQFAVSYGLSSSRPFSPFDETPIASNNIEIQKIQASNGAFREFGHSKLNMEFIELEDQMATTSGSGRSENSITIRTAQE